MGNALRAILVWGLAGTALALEPGDRVDNFMLLDHQGKAHELHYRTDAKAIVLMVQGNGCPIVRNQLVRLAQVRDAYADKGVLFMLINSNLQDDRERIAAEAKEFGIDFPILIDEAQLVGESMGFDRTAEVFVIDPQQRWRLTYRGPVDDRVSYDTQRPEATNDYLVDALDAMLAGEPVRHAHVEAEGCLINFPNQRDRDAHAQISYADEVGPILVENCAACHRPGGIGPFAFSDYNMVRGFAPMIREVVRTQRMPPWHADPHYGTFENDRALSVEDRQKLVHWIEAGAPRGEGPDPLAIAMQKEWPQWELGEPDLIVELPSYDIPATGVIDYLTPRLDNPLDEDAWVRAVDFIPGDRTVLHHIIATVAETDQQRRSLGSGLAGYVPGGGPNIYPEDTGVKLRKDAQFVLQMHYTTSGKATSDTTLMGIYFADEPPKHELRSVTLLNPRLSIPAYAREHTEYARRTFERDVLIYSLLPHSHFRGRASDFRAIYPDGSEEVLLSVPNYDFNWQHTYVLEEPKRLPAGTTLVHSTTWDNSPENRANPDPSRTVPWGQQSWDEMLFGSVRYRYADDLDEVADSDTESPRVAAGN